MTVKELRELINSRKLTDFHLQNAVKFLAKNIEKMPLGAELAFKEYIRKGAELLDIEMKDLQDVYNSFKKEIE